MSRKKVILNLDDEPDILELVEVTLADKVEEQEYEVLTFCDPLDALEELEKRDHLDLALINLMMPKMDGFEVSKRVRKMFPDCKIIMQSAGRISEEELKRVGANAFIFSPFEPRKLRQLVQEQLSGSGDS